jgi:hypothetical protein
MQTSSVLHSVKADKDPGPFGRFVSLLRLTVLAGQPVFLIAHDGAKPAIAA